MDERWIVVDEPLITYCVNMYVCVSIPSTSTYFPTASLNLWGPGEEKSHLHKYIDGETRYYRDISSVSRCKDSLTMRLSKSWGSRDMAS